MKPKDLILNKIEDLCRDTDIRGEGCVALQDYFGIEEFHTHMFPIPGIQIFYNWKCMFRLHPASFICTSNNPLIVGKKSPHAAGTDFEDGWEDDLFLLLTTIPDDLFKEEFGMDKEELEWT